MTIDTRPAPRLPLDTADYAAIEESGLGAFITFEPGEPVYQTALLQTKTPNYWPSAWNRQVYNKNLSAIYPDQTTAELNIRPVLQEFSKETPRPPQAPGSSGEPLGNLTVEGVSEAP